MSDDDGEICGCIILIIVVYLIYKVITYIYDNYSWIGLIIIFSILVIFIFGTYIFSDLMKNENTLVDKGKSFVNLGFIWFVSILIMSVVIDLLLLPPGNNRGALVFIISLVNMFGTSIFFYAGIKKLKSCDIEYRVMEGRRITYFGIFWFFFWVILPGIFAYSNIITANGVVEVFILFIAIPGTVVDIIIGRWALKIDVKKEWEYLDDAQKLFNREKAVLEGQRVSLGLEKTRFDETKVELENQRQTLNSRLKKLDEEQEKFNILKKDILAKNKDMEKRQGEINKARQELGDMWKELEYTFKENPFKLFVKEKLNKDLFIEEIKELKKAKPGDVSSIKTRADKVIDSIKEELEKEIVKIEDENYNKAFLEYFKSTNGDKIEHDRIRIKYNPTIHVQVGRRNKEWAERRRFDLSKIEKLIKEEKLTTTDR